MTSVMSSSSSSSSPSSWVLLFLGISLVKFGESSVRIRRSLVNFQQVVKCATESQPIYTFNDYGCYCSGNGPGGVEPVDEIDRCCMYHSNCYDMLVDRLICTRLSRYLDTYDWECVADDSDHDASYAPFLEAIEGVFNATGGGGRKRREFPVCKGSRSYCGISLCYCDVQASLCFAKYKAPAIKVPCTTNSTTTPRRHR